MPTSRTFKLVEANGIDKSVEGEHLAIDEDTSLLGQAATRGEPIAIADLAEAADHAAARRRDRAPAFIRCWWCRWSTSRACSDRWWCCAGAAGEFPPNLIGLMRTFAHQSVLAMRNARLFTEVDQKGRELASRACHRAAAGRKLRSRPTAQELEPSLEERVEKQLGEIERIRQPRTFPRAAGGAADRLLRRP